MERIVTTTMIQEMNLHYNDGMSMAKIGKQFNISPATVHGYIWNPRTNEKGYRKQNEVTEEQIQEINRLYNEGKTGREIGTLLGISKCTAINHVENKRLPGRRGKGV